MLEKTEEVYGFDGRRGRMFLRTLACFRRELVWSLSDVVVVLHC